MNDLKSEFRPTASPHYIPITVAAAILLIPISLITFLVRGPTLLSPFPLLVVIPALYFQSISFGSPIHLFLYAAVAVPSILFCLWGIHLFKGVPRIPRRSVIALAVLVLLTIGWFVLIWSYGVIYQGKAHTILAAVLNAIWSSVLIALARLGKTKPSYILNFMFHWLLFAWLAWCAFPYLGELW